MECYILSDLSFLPSSQKPIPTAKPLSVSFLKYQLSRTPTPKRFSRNANRPPSANLISETLRDESNTSLPKRDFRPASELVLHDAAVKAQCQSPRTTKWWPAPRQIAVAQNALGDGSVDITTTALSGYEGNSQLSAIHTKALTRVLMVEADDFTANDAIRQLALSSKIGSARTAAQEGVLSAKISDNVAYLPHDRPSNAHLPESHAKKAALKRPKKIQPLHSAPLVSQQQAAMAEVTSNRQFDVPENEKPAKVNKQKRPRIARNLPVDELELVEERLVLPYDAPPMSDSDEAESDPVEEPPAARFNRLRDLKEANVKNNTRLSKEKRVPFRSSHKRPLTLSGFRSIKPLAAVVGANEKKAWQYPAIGDGFEGSERLPAGRTSRLRKSRRHSRQQVTHPRISYYRALEIVDFKLYEGDVPAQPLEYAAPLASGVKIAPLEIGDILISDAVLSGDLLMKAASSPAIAAAAEKVIKTKQLDAVDVKEDTLQYLGLQTMQMPDAFAQEKAALVSMSGVSFKTSMMDRERASVMKEEGEETLVEEDKYAQSDEDKNDFDNMDAPQGMNVGIQTNSASSVEDNMPKYLGQTQEPDLPPAAKLIANDGKIRPVTTKIKRQVTFSDEVKIQTVVELESEEEYESGSEEQSQESDSEADKSLITDSETENSQQEDEDSQSWDGYADDEIDNEEGSGYPTTKVDYRLESPELVSSGYYVGSSSPTQLHFSFRADQTQSVTSIAQDGDNVDGYMILDMNEELDELSNSPSYTPQSKRYIDEIADSGDEMLISTSRATSTERVFMPCSDGIIDTDYCEVEPSDNLLAMQPIRYNTEQGATQKPIIQGSNKKFIGAEQAFFGVARFSKDLKRNLTDSGIAMEPQTSFAVIEQGRDPTRSISPSYSRKRAKTRLQQRGDPLTRQISVREVPSYFIQASQALASPLKDVMSARAMTLSTSQYVKSGAEKSSIISAGSFRKQLQGGKRHLSFPDCVNYGETGEFGRVVRRSNEEMGRTGLPRKRSLPFKSPMKKKVGA